LLPDVMLTNSCCSCALVRPAGQQLEEERERALTHEAAAEQLQQRIASLQELRRQQQDMYGQQVNALLMQIREAQEQVAQAAELRRKAEEKCNTARECLACSMQLVYGIVPSSRAAAQQPHYKFCLTNSLLPGVGRLFWQPCWQAAIISQS
jgi:hypothetical protein